MCLKNRYFEEQIHWVPLNTDNRVEMYIISWERNVKNITFHSRFVFNPFSQAAN